MTFHLDVTQIKENLSCHEPCNLAEINKDVSFVKHPPPSPPPITSLVGGTKTRGKEAREGIQDVKSSQFVLIYSQQKLSHDTLGRLIITLFSAK